jgi:peroxiredoxin
MKQLFSTTATLLSLALTTPAFADLAVGDQAPNFSAQGIQSEAPMTVNLSELLTKGPVVVFFFPSVFVGSSAAECRQFADNIDKFRAAGATVLGMSRDSIDALGRFSTQECAGKLPMASADMDIVTNFDVNDTANFTTWTTYVVSPSGKIVFVDDGDDYSGHAKRALAFVQGMKR